MERAARTEARPPQTERRPRQAPLSRLKGATPTRAAISWRLSVPSSGTSASKVWQATGPMPGMLCMPGGAGAQGRGGLHGGGELRAKSASWSVNQARWASRLARCGGQPGLMAALLLRGAHALELPAPGEQGVDGPGWRRRGAGAAAAGPRPRSAPAPRRRGGRSWPRWLRLRAKSRTCRGLTSCHRQPRGDQRGIHGPLVAAAGLSARAGWAAAPAPGARARPGRWACWGPARRPGSGAPRHPDDRGQYPRRDT